MTEPKHATFFDDVIKLYNVVFAGPQLSRH